MTESVDFNDAIMATAHQHHRRDAQDRQNWFLSIHAQVVDMKEEIAKFTSLESDMIATRTAAFTLKQKLNPRCNALKLAIQEQQEFSNLHTASCGQLQQIKEAMKNEDHKASDTFADIIIESDKAVIDLRSYINHKKVAVSHVMPEPKHNGSSSQQQSETTDASGSRGRGGGGA